MPKKPIHPDLAKSKCHPIPLTVDEVAIIKRLVQTYLLKRRQEHETVEDFRDHDYFPEFNSYEIRRLTLANVRFAYALDSLHAEGYYLGENVQMDYPLSNC